MPETVDRASPSVPPEVIVSGPRDRVANLTIRSDLASSRRRSRPSARTYSKEQATPTSPDWVDIEEYPRRRRRSARHSPQYQSKTSPSRSQARSRLSEGGVEGDFSRLGRISEVNESTISSRRSTRDSDQRRRRDRSSTRSSRYRDEGNPTYRRPQKHRTGGVQRRTESQFKFNPSLLSVISTLTGTSDRSSGSSSTITQESYDRRSDSSKMQPATRPKRSEPVVAKQPVPKPPLKAPNVFDFMEPEPAEDDAQDTQSVAASSAASSQYEPSEAGSSEAPPTPSSRSTFPSPTSARSQSSVAELRTKFDSQNTPTTPSMVIEDRSPEPSIRSIRKVPSVSDIPEDDEDASVAPTARSEVSFKDRQRSTSRSSRTSRRGSDRLQQQEESLRQHMAHSQGHFVEPVYGQHRSFSTGSAHSDHSSYMYPHMAMQQYNWPSPLPAPIPLHAPPQTMMNGHIAPYERPSAPEAPDLTQRTLTGYEMLALELSTSDSQVKPLYRKFEYLNHRILLHLQDELSELEEQLRTLDEIIAQMDPGSPDGQKLPASRRGDAIHGSELHHRRRDLLGCIFVKTEQYNKAMAAYNAIAKNSVQPEEDQISAYKRWMAKHAPVHEIETRFLQRGQDLIVPGSPSGSSAGAGAQPTKQAALASSLPVALMLPILLYSIIPTLAGRLTATTVVAGGAFIVATTTRIRYLMSGREWALCGAAYMLLMSAVAGCIPQHGS